MKRMIGLIICFTMVTNTYAIDYFPLSKESKLKTVIDDLHKAELKAATSINFSLPTEPVITCAQPSLETLGFTNTKSVKGVLKKMLCDKSDSQFFSFKKNDCATALSCRRTFDESQDEKKKIDALLTEIIVKDYVKNSIQNELPEFERFEMLKAFAIEKKSELSIGNISKGASCRSRYEVKKECNREGLDKIFSEEQDSCSGVTNGCYADLTSGLMGFKSFKKENPDSKFLIADFSKYRVETILKKQKADENSYLDNLASLISSTDFKNASADKKAELFAKFLNQASSIDPVLGYDLKALPGSVTKENVLKSSQIVALYNGNNYTKESFKINFNKFRKKRVEEVLSSAQSCSIEEPSLNRICFGAMKIVNPAGYARTSEFVKKVSSSKIISPEAIAQIKKTLGSRFNESNFTSLVNARRCESFGILNNAEVAYDGTIISPLGDRTKADDIRDDVRDYEKTPSSLSSLEGLNTVRVGRSFAAINSDDSSVTSTPAIRNLPVSESLADAASIPSTNVASNPAAINSFPASNYSDLYKPSAYENTPEGKASSGKTSEQVSANEPSSKASLDAQINDLSKRLAEAEAKVEKMKASNEEAETERVKQKKIDEENALVKDLRDQITDLKTQNAKKATVAKGAAAPAPESDYQREQYINNFVAPNRGDTPKTITRTEYYEPSRNEYQTSSPSGAISSGSKTGSSSSGLTLTSTSGDKGALNLTFITIDGMSAEKVTETISNRILELKGVPFYVEEAGMMKEIIPLMKDGKVVLDEKGNPVFEKITKGKAKDKKFAKRLPASKDAADLKREDEAKAEAIRKRAEYLKLKELMNGIIKDK